MWPLASFVLRSAWDTLKRFPGPLLAGVASGALLIDAEHRNFRGEEPLEFMLAASLGLPLGTALVLLAEHPPRLLERIPARRALAFALTLLVTAAYAAGLYATRGQGESYLLRYAQLSVAAHLAVAFAPYLARTRARAAQTRGAWQLGRHLFLRLPLSAVYALVVFGGLALALGASVQLFDLDIDSDRYFELWASCTFVLQTWHFLAGVPRDWGDLERDDAYPRGLRIFAQFVLLPLLGLYLAILYAYAAKILISGHLPNRWVGWLVSAAGGFGMLSLLLLFPARRGPLGRFVRRVETGFHLAILPLLVLLFASLSVRLDAYGITERRYFLGVLGLWLAAASIYRLKWGRRTLTWIPISLCLVAGLTSFGPWGALAVARENQSARLTSVLQKTGRLAGPASSAEPASLEDRRRMSRILDYLVEAHGTGTLRRWPGPNGPSDSAGTFMQDRGLDYVTPYASRASTLSFYGRGDLPVAVDGYDWLVPYAVYAGHDAPEVPSRFTVRLSAAAVEVLDGGKLRATISLVPILERVERERPQEKGNTAPLVVSAESNGLRLRLIVTQLEAEGRSGQWLIRSTGGDLLVDE